jgi:hypothetical protein
MKDKLICEWYNDCPLNNKSCYHLTPHYNNDNCSFSKDFPLSESLGCKCGRCLSITEIRKLKLEKINENK